MEQLRERAYAVVNNERGEIGVKTVALAVAAVVIIAFVVSMLTGGWLENVIDTVWNYIWENIQGMFS